MTKVALGIFAITAVTAWGQTPNRALSWLPSDALRGFADIEIALPHNEIDLGLCTLAVSNPFPNHTCAAYARYALSGYLELRPFAKTPLRQLFGIFEPKYFAGNNIPQVRYTASATPILWESTVGAGYELPRHFELRYTHHVANLLGSYSGSASLRPDGPYGKNSTIGARWNFGGWGRTPNSSLLRGFVDLEFAPPHYEVDLGLCTLTATNPPAPGCAAYARYVWDSYVELRPSRLATWRHLALFAGPKVFEGNNIPQLRYNGSPALILSDLTAGVAYDLPKHFELRFTQHEVTPLARYAGAVGAATLRSHGPYGPYTTIGLRWNFGGW